MTKQILKNSFQEKVNCPNLAERTISFLGVSFLDILLSTSNEFFEEKLELTLVSFYAT